MSLKTFHVKHSRKSTHIIPDKHFHEATYQRQYQRRPLRILPQRPPLVLLLVLCGCFGRKIMKELTRDGITSTQRQQAHFPLQRDRYSPLQTLRSPATRGEHSKNPAGVYACLQKVSIVESYFFSPAKESVIRCSFGSKRVIVNG